MNGGTQGPGPACTGQAALAPASRGSCTRPTGAVSPMRMLPVPPRAPAQNRTGDLRFTRAALCLAELRGHLGPAASRCCASTWREAYSLGSPHRRERPPSGAVKLPAGRRAAPPCNKARMPASHRISPRRALLLAAFNACFLLHHYPGHAAVPGIEPGSLPVQSRADLPASPIPHWQSARATQDRSGVISPLLPRALPGRAIRYLISRPRPAPRTLLAPWCCVTAAAGVCRRGGARTLTCPAFEAG
jgi:hypothetical protein